MVSFGHSLAALVILCGLSLPTPGAEPSEATLRAADAEQMRIIVEADAKAQQAFMHPNYIINGPSNEVRRKAILVDMLAHGKMASDRFERVLEGLAITENVGIVMGREIVHPLPRVSLEHFMGTRSCIVASLTSSCFKMGNGAFWRGRPHSLIEEFSGHGV